MTKNKSNTCCPEINPESIIEEVYLIKLAIYGKENLELSEGLSYEFAALKQQIGHLENAAWCLLHNYHELKKQTEG